MPEMQVATLQYHVVMAPVAGPVNWIPGGEYPLINFQFEQAAGEDGTIPFDYSSFDQDTHETAMRALLNGICGAMAGNLGLDLAVVQAAVSVRRTWTMTGPTQVAGSYPSLDIGDFMSYP
jgi:hypothetical protein